ncbi:NAD(P)H-binding protein [Vibrio sp. M60_M31a]
MVKSLTNQPEINQTLFLRNPKKLAEFDLAQAQIVVGNVLDRELLKSSMSGQDIVYANLIGDDLDKQAEAVIDAMQETGVKRLIFVLSLGIYDEIPVSLVSGTTTLSVSR